MQEFISILKYILHSNIINFVLMMVILVWLVRKLNLGKTFDDSVSVVEAGIKKSDEAKQKALQNLDDAKALMERLPADIKAMKLSGENKGEIFKQEIENNAQKTISNINHNVEHTIEVEEKKFSNVMIDKTSIAAVELAGAHIIDLLKADPELHNKFIQDSLDEIDKVKL
ncbi:MAG: hypothetical protein NC191_02655 [Muribaculaceae bacterium]|nr:hypothetical protein [Muribaculaceae bacterium]